MTDDSTWVRFRPRHPWALLPVKHAVEPHPKEDPLEQHFRWESRRRIPERCGPWRLGQEIGWYVRSPIDVTLTPIEDIEVRAGEAELPEVASITGHTEIWPREESYLALRPTSWMRRFRFRTASGWESMFVPNGAGSVEWHLGCDIELPSGYFMLVLPESSSKLEVLPAVLSDRILARLAERAGFGIAFRVREPITLKRGDKIARLLALHPASLRMSALE